MDSGRDSEPGSEFGSESVSEFVSEFETACPASRTSRDARSARRAPRGVLILRAARDSRRPDQGIHDTRTPFVRLNVAAEQNVAESRYHSW